MKFLRGPPLPIGSTSTAVTISAKNVTVLPRVLDSLRRTSSSACTTMTRSCFLPHCIFRDRGAPRILQAPHSNPILLHIRHHRPPRCCYVQLGRNDTSIMVVSHTKLGMRWPDISVQRDWVLLQLLTKCLHVCPPQQCFHLQGSNLGKEINQYCSFLQRWWQLRIITATGIRTQVM